MIEFILTGPESSGKTTLAKNLAEYFNVPVANEYVRIFFSEKKNNAYTLPDLKAIAKGQIKLENAACHLAVQQKKSFYISDTDLITLKIWSEEVFGTCDDFILKNLRSPTPLSNQIYFLCSPKDIPWESDPLRENPNDRERLFDIYLKTLSDLKKQFIILEGDEETRFQKAVKLITKYELGIRNEL